MVHLYVIYYVLFIYFSLSTVILQVEGVGSGIWEIYWGVRIIKKHF